MIAGMGFVMAGKLKIEKIQDAIALGDVKKVCKLLDQGAIPKHKSDWWRNHLIRQAIVSNHVEIVKLFLQFNIETDRTLIDYFFQIDNIDFVEKLVARLIKHHKDIKLIERIFFKLVYSEAHQGQLGVVILKLLIENGLPIDDYIGGMDFTPLQLCIKNKRIDLFQELLKNKADVKKRRKNGDTFLYYLIDLNDTPVEIMELLLKKGILINEKSCNGQTALHRACMVGKVDVAVLLLKYGADVNVLDCNNLTALLYVRGPKILEIIIKELAKLKIECRPVCLVNLEYLKIGFNGALQEFYEECLDELRKMRNHVVYHNFTLYEILKMRKKRKKLIHLTKNEDFVAAYVLSWDREIFEIYGNDLDEIFAEALDRRDILLNEEEKLYSIFKDYLPLLVIRKITYIIKQDLIFNE